MPTSRSTSTTTPRSTRATRGTTAKTAARRRRSALTALLATLATAALLLGAAACGSDATLTEAATGAEPTEPTAAAIPAPTTQAEPAPAPTTPAEPAPVAPQGAPAEIMRQANAAWRAQDWAGLGQFATADVVAVAQAASSPEDEGPLELVGDDLDNAWRCSLDGTSCTEGLWACDSGGTSCNGEILYGHEPDAGCCAAIYRVTITDTGNGFQVTSLSFAGDAG